MGVSGVKLLSRCLLISSTGWFAFSKVITSFILLSHAIHQQQDKENRKEKADNSASNDRWNMPKGRLLSGEIQGLQKLTLSSPIYLYFLKGSTRKTPKCWKTGFDEATSWITQIWHSQEGTILSVIRINRISQKPQ